MNHSRKHPIRAVSRKTGLSPHVIRAWERRHGAISPARTSSNQRLYSDEDIVRLSLLHRAIEAGYSIGQIADLTDDELRRLVGGADGITSTTVSAGETRREPYSAREHLDNSITAVRDFDQRSLEYSLTMAAADLSQPVLMEQVLVPLMVHIGECWGEGSMRVAHEHMASAIVRSFLGRITDAMEVSESAPDLIVSTPSGQAHELGALIVAAIALSQGWRVTYLGPNLPAEDVSSAARQRNSRVVALSIVYPPDDSRVNEELRKLRRFLPVDTRIIAGGRAASAYRRVLNEIDADIILDIPSLRVYLDDLRAG